MKNRELTFKPEQEKIIGKCDFCHLSMIDTEGMPYVIPMNFGYKKDVIYLHCAPTGKKIDALKANPNVCVAFSTDHELRYQTEDVACSYSMKYRSVLCYGKVEFIEDFDTKIDALNIIMAQYTDIEFGYNDPAVKGVCVFKVTVEKMDGRAYGY